MAEPAEHLQRTTPLGLLRYAIEFYAAAIATDDALGHDAGYEVHAPATVNYLMGHGIELGLKSFLLQHGASLGDLKNKFGHRLVVCHREAEKRGLAEHIQLSREQRYLLGITDALYSSKQFEYIETGPKIFPVFGPLQTLAKALLLAIIPTIPLGVRHLQSKAGRILTGAA